MVSGKRGGPCLGPYGQVQLPGKVHVAAISCPLLAGPHDGARRNGATCPSQNALLAVALGCLNTYSASVYLIEPYPLEMLIAAPEMTLFSF